MLYKNSKIKHEGTGIGLQSFSQNTIKIISKVGKKVSRMVYFPKFHKKM